MTEYPPHMMIVDEDGRPISMLDVNRMHSDSTRLMYQVAAAAGDKAEMDRIAREWMRTLPPSYFGFVAAGALSQMARNVLAPLLELLDEALPQFDFRGKLAESRDEAERTLGGDQ